MTDLEAKQHIDNLIHAIKIMKVASVDKQKLSEYIEALNIAYARLSIKPPISRTNSPISGQVSIEDYMREINGG